jgi:Mg2+/citrate symporter
LNGAKPTGHSTTAMLIALTCVNERRNGTLDFHPTGTPMLRLAGAVALAPAQLVGIAQPGANAGTLGAILEAPALVAGLDDVPVVGEAIEQRPRSCLLPGRSKARAFERTRTTTEWPFARASRTISRV